jgi:glycosyltransferase involved in cell wall biosynthesis
VSRPRTLYVIQHREWSGAETSQAPPIAADENALMACPAGSPTEEFAHSLGVPTVDLPFRSLRHSGGFLELIRSVGRGLRSARDMRRVVRETGCDVVYGTSIRPNLIASVGCIGMRTRIVWCVPDLLPPWPLRGPVRLLAWLRASRILTLSGYIADDLVGRSRRLRRLTRVVHPGVDPAAYDPSRADPGDASAAIVGFISPVKRTGMAVDIAELVAERRPGFRLKVIGAAQFRNEDFALERELRARAEADERLGKAVEFAGRTRDVAGELAGVGALLHCRPDEPFGMVMVEAMAQGLPVVAPASGGPLEIVEDGVSGLLYEPEDAGDAASKLLALIEDPERARSMGSAARQRAVERFSAARQVEETRALIQDAFGVDRE